MASFYVAYGLVTMIHLARKFSVLFLCVCGTMLIAFLTRLNNSEQLCSYNVTVERYMLCGLWLYL